jgi:hypothetical protein
LTVNGVAAIDSPVRRAEQAWATAIENKMQNAEGGMQKLARGN